MKRCRMISALLLLTAILSAGMAPATADERKEQANIRDLLSAQAEAWNRGDIDGFMDGYWKSDQTTFSGSSGVFRGWQALLERYRRNYPDRAAMGRLTFSDLEITMLSRGAALVLGRWQLATATGHPGGVFTLVLRKFPQGWRIIHDHTSAVEKPPANRVS
jgi:ketosteroid isomerase-like protein